MMINEKDEKSLNAGVDQHWARNMVLFSTLFNSVGHTIINTGDAIATLNPSASHISQTIFSSCNAACGGIFVTGLALIMKHSLGDKTELAVKKQFCLILIAGALTKMPQQDLSAMMLELGASALGLISILALCHFLPDEEDQPLATSTKSSNQLN